MRLNIKFFLLLISLLTVELNAQTICIDKKSGDQKTGTKDGYRYELWNQNSQGTACMTIGDGALFSGEWDGILNYLARRGLKYDETKTHREIGRFIATYDCDYRPTTASGNSYLSIYGWTSSPLIEFYIIEDWRNWIPSMDANATTVGNFTIDGSKYKIVKNTRVNQPSIQGTRTFEQYFSIRETPRTSGTIDITAHFEEWEKYGLELGKMYEVSFVVEGYQSKGSFEFRQLTIVDDDSTLSIDKNEVDTNTKVEVNSSDIKVSFEASNEKKSVSLFNIAGKSIAECKNTNNDFVTFNNIDKGFYVVVIASNNVKMSKKVIVN